MCQKCTIHSLLLRLVPKPSFNVACVFFQVGRHCTSHFLATMDLKTLRKFRNLIKDVGSRLQDFSNRASLSDMLDICDSVQASPNGTPIVFPACTPILHFSDYCHVGAVYSPPWGLVDGVLFVDMCFVVCIEGLSILSGYGRVPECETSGF